MRNAVLHGIATTPTHLKTPEEIALERRAISAISEYRLVKDGVTDYVAMGYGIEGGGVSEVKLLEYLAIESEFAEALNSKHHGN